MARFGSTVAFVVGGKRYEAGQTYADTFANALAGDVVWLGGLDSTKMSPGFVPLDGAAVTMKGASVFANQIRLIDGCNSIEG